MIVYYFTGNLSCSSRDRDRGGTRLGCSITNMATGISEPTSLIFAKHDRLSYHTLCDDTRAQSHCLYWYGGSVYVRTRIIHTCISFFLNHLLGFSLVCSQPSLHAQEIPKTIYPLVPTCRLEILRPHGLLVCSLTLSYLCYYLTPLHW